MADVIETTGKVTCVRVVNDTGFVQLVDAAGVPETFVLWSAPEELTAFERIMHSMWVSFLRESLTKGLPVTVVHLDNDARATAVQLGDVQ
jgi:hypothetical protein